MTFMIPYGGLDGMSLLSFWKLSSIKLVVSLDEIEVLIFDEIQGVILQWID